MTASPAIDVLVAVPAVAAVDWRDVSGVVR
jgi:hypothetical protein